MNVLVLSTDEYLTLRLLKCLAAMGAAVHVVGPGGAVRASRFCRRYTAVSSGALAAPSERTRALLARLCAQDKIDAVLPSGMAAVFLLAGLGRELGGAPVLPTPPLEHLRVLNNKWEFARLLQRSGLPLPPTRLLAAPEDAQTLDLDFPVIVKPLDLDAGRGVARCDTPDALAAHAERHQAALPLLVQEYVPGADVGLGLLIRAGRVAAWTIQRQNPDGSGVAFIEHPGVLGVGEAIAALGPHDGVLHFDMRLDARDGSVKVLECNPRFWASLPWCLIAGVNFAEGAIRLAQGGPPPPTTYRTVGLTFPSKLLAGARRLDEPTRRALRTTLADPLPLLCLGAGNLGRRVTSLFPNPPWRPDRL